MINIFDTTRKTYLEFNRVEEFKSQSRIKISSLYCNFLWKSITDPHKEMFNKIVLKNEKNKSSQS